MTICIAAHGRCAGRAVVKALAAVECASSGAIGGFVSAVSLDDSRCIRAETQVGGSAYLEYEQSRTLFEEAGIAGLISSGPNRPSPLAEFLPAIPGIGLVTGHRSPSCLGDSGEPLNLQVLQGLQSGLSCHESVDAIVDANPDADAGFIAMSSDGVGYAANTSEVLKRPDVGIAELNRNGTSVLVMHNAISPVCPMAELAAQVAMDTLCPTFSDVNMARLQQGCEVIEGPENAIHIDDDSQVLRITVAMSFPCHEREQKVVLNLGYQPRVYMNNRRVGVLIYEPYLLTSNGRLISADGQSTYELSVGCVTQQSSNTDTAPQ